MTHINDDDQYLGSHPRDPRAVDTMIRRLIGGKAQRALKGRDGRTK